ncbi:hypothetical protein Pmar_PMAR007687 [Perkinsus marinus ATCC 50983]|uniref:C3H1-type domain-containing protein n=1 Tax=Perkinsus marinus (strain ATCC 50983 / TXsc) TaxID=423536 RepID=C5LMV0_PERM5|nr:hypothetical protein Pmar_PMAR007687 [Perkinsus marinus ATCC 50983]EER01991.1 hypothetical protein Pmar_PMAR007687 [Perkinsus marinus ATCC 50983]|eukprot:XP_002769273.1 hypothetical protein Pmar_PMAR007687 [Perkinsus marinus ATCC 50983]
MRLPPPGTAPSLVDVELVEMTKEWSPIKKRMYKTQVCKYFIRGRCMHGLLCAFAHSVDELNRKPDLSKTKLCTKVGCVDPGCAFAHTLAELRVDPAVNDNSMEKQILARFDNPTYADYFEEQRRLLSAPPHTVVSRQSPIKNEKPMLTRVPRRQCPKLSTEAYNFPGAVLQGSMPPSELSYGGNWVEIKRADEGKLFAFIAERHHT